jgi:RimJ/RimL family protein N-acetyltransferase
MSALQERRIHAVLREAKEKPTSWRTAIPLQLNGHLAARLEPVTTADARQEVFIDLLAQWRAASADYFPTQFPVTREGTRRWLIEQVLQIPDRILFWIRGDHDGACLGHIGLFHLDAAQSRIELDNVVRGRSGILPGVMEASVQSLMRWTAQHLGVDTMSLRVFADNLRAVRLYDRCGFATAQEIPLVKLHEGPVTRWVEQSDHPGLRSERRFLVMERRCRQERVSPVLARMAA